MPNDPNAPSMWLIFFWGFIFMGGLIFLLWLNHKWVTRGQPKSETPEEKEHTPPSPSIADIIMSRFLGQAGPIEGVAAPLPPEAPEARQRMAMRGNAVNAPLPGNALPDEVREVVRFWAMVEVAERIIANGKIGQAETIELVFNCKRSGRPDSPYARARAALQAREQPRYLHPLNEDQQRLREELALE